MVNLPYNSRTTYIFFILWDPTGKYKSSARNCQVYGLSVGNQILDIPNLAINLGFISGY
jgi:hypothetical protein